MPTVRQKEKNEYQKREINQTAQDAKKRGIVKEPKKKPPLAYVLSNQNGQPV